MKSNSVVFIMKRRIVSAKYILMHGQLVKVALDEKKKNTLTANAVKQFNARKTRGYFNI